MVNCYKNEKSEEIESGGAGVDPLSLALLTGQVRSLLRFHLLMGVDGYPKKEGLLKFARSGKGTVAPVGSRPYQRSTAPLTAPGPDRAGSGAEKRPDAPVPSSTSGHRDRPPSAASLQALARDVSGCRACSLAENRLGQVLGQGPRSPHLMVVGDYSLQTDEFSPAVLFGREEDGMLWRMMEAIGLDRDGVYVSNVLKCCPKSMQQGIAGVEQCASFLHREIGLLKPRIILAMGESAASCLLGVSAPLVRVRGRFHPYRYPESCGARVMPTFHPRFLLVHAEMKKMVWHDLQVVQRCL